MFQAVFGVLGFTLMLLLTVLGGKGAIIVGFFTGFPAMLGFTAFLGGLFMVAFSQLLLIAARHYETLP
ncbi:hypothetical protein EON79_22905 [bacterium]|nr:MAG: hypothetical protein EON79_22905 [bacterium]